ncbi:MAG: hypothetical protein PHF56_25140 [Desulfuromonadaceae bacterium]|nr:hypothetical protein [Desulfuromonadaceae bacterium]
MTDWNKVIEVFGSGVLGVLLIMGFLMILLQISFKVIEYFERCIEKPTSEKA